MHGRSERARGYADHPHTDLVLHDDQALPVQPHEESCFYCGCRKCCCMGEIAPSTRFLSWISGFIFFAAGSYEGGQFRRAMYSNVISRLLSLRLVNWNSVDGIRIRTREVVISNKMNAVVFERAADAEQARASQVRRPIFLFLHGGGFCIGDPYEKMFYDFCKFFAAKGYVVVSPAYRLAPENPFPAAVEDAFEALRFIAHEPGELPGGDRQRLIVGGDSAGGNLALVVATLWRDGLNARLEAERLPDVRIAHLVLMYPTLLLPFPTRSVAEFHDGVMLPYWLSSWFLKSYLPDEKTRQHVLETDRRVCPLHAGLFRLPPVALVSGSHDPFRDECMLLNNELLHQGTAVVHHVYENVPHGFGTIFTESARECQRQIFRDLVEAGLEPCGGAGHPYGGVAPPLQHADSKKLR